MPPKPKFSRQEITDCALKIVSELGVDALTARALGSRLGSSARPIFTVFDGMEELQCEVRRAAMARFEAFSEKVPCDMPSFKRTGMQMLIFASAEPKLYQLLFMRENASATSFHDVFTGLGDEADKSIETLKTQYGLSQKDAETLFENMWIYTYGVGTLCATGACRFSHTEFGNMLTAQFNAQMLYIKHGEI